MKGDSVTILVDCATQMTKALKRTVTATVATDGLILTGVQLVEGESFFIGDLQQLLIADTPDEAYNLCSKYTPSCSGSVGGYSGSYVSEVTGGQGFSSSAEVTRSASASSSSSSSFSAGSASRTSSLLSGSSSTAASGSSRYDANLSRDRVQVGGSSNVGGGSVQNSRTATIQSGGSRAAGGSSEMIQVGSQGQAGGKGELGEIREDIYGLCGSKPVIVEFSFS